MTADKGRDNTRPRGGSAWQPRSEPAGSKHSRTSKSSCGLQTPGRGVLSSNRELREQFFRYFARCA